MLFRLLLPLALLSLLAACTALPSSGPDRPVRIVSWNVEHLAEREGTGCRPRTAEEYAQLRNYADALQADVVAFQEVESAAAAARVFDPAKYAIVIESR